MKSGRSALLAASIVALVCGGCAIPTTGAAPDTPRQVGTDTAVPTEGGPASGGPVIRSAELDELTRAFADRYVGLLSSACDALKKDNRDPAQRREAQELLVDGATNVYDIASNADSFTRVLDLIVVTTLVSQIWIDDDRATEVFADRAGVLVRALHHGRMEAWALGAQVLSPEQMDLMDYILWDWRRHNPDMVRAYFVRFSNFAIGRGQSANAEVLAAGGLFGNVGQAGQAIEEARLLTERMFYRLKRAPTLIRWQAEALEDATLATPGTGQALADVHRLTDLVEQLPQKVAAERQALLAALDERWKLADATVSGIRATVSEAKDLLDSMGPVSESLRETFQAADSLLARYDSKSRGATAPGTHPFDVREFTVALNQLTVAAGRVNEVIESSNRLLASSDWDRRVQQVNQSADDRMKMASEQSRRVIGDLFRHVYVAMGILCGLVLLCLVTVFLLVRRLRLVATCSRDAGGKEASP